MDLLKFSLGQNNSKLKKLEELTQKKLYTFSLLSGSTCLGANECLAWVEQLPNHTRRLVDGSEQKFRCFSASLEVAFPTVYNQRKHNTDLVKKCKTKKELIDLFEASLPQDAQIIRLHIGGDHLSQKYFDAWLQVARNHPKILFYSYTKSLPFWVKRKNEIPKNFSLVASVGGRWDSLISSEKLRYAKVVFSQEEADKLKLEVDWDDSHAALPKYRNKSFGLMLHNKQQPGSEAAQALKLLTKKKKTSSKKV